MFETRRKRGQEDMRAKSLTGPLELNSEQRIRDFSTTPLPEFENISCIVSAIMIQIYLDKLLRNMGNGHINTMAGSVQQTTVISSFYFCMDFLPTLQYISYVIRIICSR